MRFCTAYQPSDCCVFDSPSSWPIRTLPILMRCNNLRESCVWARLLVSTIIRLCTPAHGTSSSAFYSITASHENRLLPDAGMDDIAFLGRTGRLSRTAGLHPATIRGREWFQWGTGRQTSPLLAVTVARLQRSVRQQPSHHLYANVCNVVHLRTIRVTVWKLHLDWSFVHPEFDPTWGDKGLSRGQ